MAQLSFQSLLAADASREQIEEWCRKQTQSYTYETGVICRVLGKYLMAVGGFDVALAPHLVLDGIWEPWVTMAIARHVKPGMRCMDVGACFGYYSLLMADLVGPSGHVQAWEPFWQDAVKINAIMNGFPIEVIQAAMGTVKRSVTLVKSENIGRSKMFNAGGVSFRERTERDGGALAIVLSPPAESWDFIKIDVEGAEADVWNALAGVRKQSPNLTVCMEFTPKSHADPDVFLLALVGDGFVMGTVGHDGVPRRCSLEEALVPDTGDFRMLWLQRNQ